MLMYEFARVVLLRVSDDTVGVTFLYGYQVPHLSDYLQKHPLTFFLFYIFAFNFGNLTSFIQMNIYFFC